MEKGLITRAALQRLAGAAVFRRGEEYFSAGAVCRLRDAAEKISARVDGSEAYQVVLRDEGGDLDGDCTCPHAADGNFCKHCVAVGLAWLANQPAVAKSGTVAAKRARHDPWLEIKAYLTTQPAETLAGLLLDVAERDDRLYQSLLLKAGQAGFDKGGGKGSGAGGGNVLKTLRRAIDEATRVRGFIGWREASSFAHNIEQVTGAMAELLAPSSAAMLVELTEYAIERVENALEQIDDSNGETGDIVYRLGELHLKACGMARPDPLRLAERLLRFETTLPFSLCSFDPVTYSDVLGKTGVEHYRQRVQAEWHKLKPHDARQGYDAHAATITRIMERMAEASGDIDELVVIKSRDLSASYRYIEIAEIWHKARQADKSLEWAERGLKAFPKLPDNRLRDFLVAVYLKRKRNDEALQLTWIQFEERACLDYYKKLHGVARRIGLWAAQRERALAWLAERIACAAASKTTARWPPQPSNNFHSLRVEIALWEKDNDAAWTAANQGECSQHLLIALAGLLEATRPDDAVDLYRRVVPRLVGATDNAAYAEAIKLIRKVARLLGAQQQTRQLGDYLAELRTRFKPKRNFIKLLDEVARDNAEA